MIKIAANEIYLQGQYGIKNPTWHIQDSAWKAKQILKMMEKNQILPDSICEVGCGTGEVLHQLYLNLPTDLQFVGYEIAPHGIGYIKRPFVYSIFYQIIYDKITFRWSGTLSGQS